MIIGKVGNVTISNPKLNHPRRSASFRENDRVAEAIIDRLNIENAIASQFDRDVARPRAPTLRQGL